MDFIKQENLRKDERQVKKTHRSLRRSGFLLVGMGFEAAILLWFFIYIGQKWDLYFNTGGGITAGLVLLALVIWFYQLILLFRKQ